MTYESEPRRRVLGRRGLLGAAPAATLGALSLAGCGGRAGQEQIGVQLWHLFTGGDGGIFTEMLEQAGAALPDVAIDPIVLTWGGPYYTKLAMASVGGRAPDAAVMHASRIPGHAPGGLLEPWDLEALAKAGVREEGISPAIWEKGTYEGDLFGVPLDFHAFPLFYNTRLCEEAGVLDSDGKLIGMDSVEGFYDVADAIVEATGQHAISYGYTGSGAQVSRLFWGLYAQIAGQAEFTPGEPADFDTDAGTQVVEFIQGLLDDVRAPRNLNEDSAIAAFSSERSAILFSGNWEVPTFLDAGIPFDVMPMPTVFDQPATFGDSHVFVLPKQDNPDPERREATYRVVATMLANSQLWAQGGHVPASTEILTSADYQSMAPQSHYAAAAETPAFPPEAWFTGSGSDFQARVSEALEPAFLYSDDAATAVDRLRAAIDAALQSTPPF
jgi:multiple sugar transport system substrate-binding protein